MADLWPRNDWAVGQVPSKDDFNAVANAFRVWMGDVDGGGNKLSNIKSLSVSSAGSVILATTASKVGVGTATGFCRFTIADVSQAAVNAAAGAGNFAISTGTGAQTDDSLLMGVHTGDYSWIQAIKAGTAVRNLLLNPLGGNVGLVCTAPTDSLQVGQSGANYSLSVVGSAGNKGIISAFGDAFGFAVNRRTSDGVVADTGKASAEIIVTGAVSSGSIAFSATNANNGSPALHMKIFGDGNIAMYNIPSTYPGAGTKRLWYDPADGNRLKFAA